MKKTFVLSLIVGIPFVLGTTIVAYWYWADVLHKKPPLPTLGSVPQFSLVDEEKHTATRNILNGKVTVADFIFTSCAGTCPMMSSQMAELQKSLADEPRVQFVSFSVDPETDTPEILAQYARQYGAKKGKWMFLTGTRQEVFKLTREGFHLAVDVDTGEGGDILHSQKFVLVDSNATIRGYYDSEDSLATQSLLSDVKRLSGQAR